MCRRRDIRSRQLGFSLLEIIIVVAIIAVIAAVAIPAMTSATDNARLQGTTRQLLGHLAMARQLAATGKKDPQFGGVVTWPNNESTLNAGILIQNTGYQVFIDRDQFNNGDEITMEVVDFTTEQGKRFITITNPAPGIEIRFKRNGTLTTNANQTITLQDSNTNKQETITVFFGGTAQVD